ncbi:hypothetical protein ACTFIW_001035, partial [Dictyostelium discoideum]
MDDLTSKFNENENKNKKDSKQIIYAVPTDTIRYGNSDSKLENSFYSKLINDSGLLFSLNQIKEPFSKIEQSPIKTLQEVLRSKNFDDYVNDKWIEKPKEKTEGLSSQYPHWSIWFFVSNCERLAGYNERLNDDLLVNISSLITNSVPLWNDNIKGNGNVKTLFCQFIRYLVDNSYHNSIITYFMVNAFDQPGYYQPNGIEKLFFSNIANNEYFFEYFVYIRNQKKVLEYFFREYHMLSNGENLDTS